MNNLKDLVGGSITDVPCKYCGSNSTYQYNTDEAEFSYDGTGHYYVDYDCKDCNSAFRVYFGFEYEITRASYGGR